MAGKRKKFAKTSKKSTNATTTGNDNNNNNNNDNVDDKVLKKSKAITDDSKNVWGPNTMTNEHPQGTKDWYTSIAKNDDFEFYYKKMNLLPNEEDFKKFMEWLGKPLPTTFRINRAIGESLTNVVKKQLHNIIDQLPEKMIVDGDVVEPPKPLSWYPDELAWHSTLTKRSFRKNDQLEAFHKFLMHHNNEGNLTRQEAVSMIPPIFLDVEPHHLVLDMCAAPGSKTTQIIEALHANRSNSNTTIPEGMIIANDADVKRCYMLVHQTARLGSPTIVITNHEAQIFPLLYLQKEGETERRPMLFDRILADVPCSGDGTLRKNPDLWKRWKARDGAGLHRLQSHIAYRAANLLKVGGRMVYSTCSLNPIENEAVIMELVNRCQGAVRIVDVSAQYPTLIRANGLHTWPVIDKDREIYQDFSQVPETKKKTIFPSFFPPTEEQAQKAGLKHCMRVYPHMQDTGGFFITVLEKVAELPDQIGKRIKYEQEFGQNKQDQDTTTPPLNDESSTTPPLNDESTSTTTTTTTTTQVKEKKSAVHKFFEEPFGTINEECKKDLDVAEAFYGINKEFPLREQMLTRSQGSKVLYFASKPIVNIVEGDRNRRLKIINAGLEILKKHDEFGESKCNYRICQSASQWITPYMTVHNTRTVIMSPNDLFTLLRTTEPLFTQFPKSIEDQLEALEHGCFIIKIDTSLKTSLEDANKDKQVETPMQTDQDDIIAQSNGMVFASWRGKRSIHLLVQKQELQLMANIFKVTIEHRKGDVNPKNYRVPNSSTESPTTESPKNESSTDAATSDTL
ncbi:NOL1/NOP2/Sun family protein [Cavenderia fasciculata]|uniref:NOL1/NOP2/Sun family protein n=1 Tax=Cavenderia fasciculata TaxID=261658 RepID=F4Q649_CACFS|nr:NOL1/NOP2/Sun family protein [Cavenderia fasciculata]EGG16635.1 NOL1/NOP2/Sun family protein [Cavenderia fasciculata]|eukprot:XP_004355109.1 NOL1/NOP2/Sun family protein [Cavenderia fasciculata]